MRRAFLLFAAIAAAAGVLAAPAAPKGMAKQIVVDKDKVQCPKANFTSIQAAVNAASPGDTIKVCPDQYNESVTVNKPSLTLVGSTNISLSRCTTLSAADPTQDAIVTGAGSFSFSLQNYNITLSGFVVQGAFDGIDTSGLFSGYRVTTNILQNNAIRGIDFLSNGTYQSRIDHNCIRANGNGLQSEVLSGSDLRNGLVDHNVVFQNGNSGLDFSGAGARAYVTVTANDASANAGSAFTMDNSTGTSLDHNTSTGDGFGFYIGGGNNGLNISNNTATDSVVNGIIFNQAAFFPVFTGANVGLTVNANTVTGAGSSGIVANVGAPNLTLSTVSNNVSSNNGRTAPRSGIRLQAGNDNNQVTNNTADKNSANGIHADGATGNTFTNNHMNLNVEFDARDENRPANTWTANQCTTDFPAGTICGV